MVDATNDSHSGVISRRTVLGLGAAASASAAVNAVPQTATSTGRTNDLVMMDAVSLASAIRSRQTSCVEVMTAYLDHIEKLNVTVNAIVALQDRMDLLSQARERDKQPAHGEFMGPLHGFPHAVKDLQAVKGIRTTMGSPILKNSVRSADSLMVERLRKAGAIFIGKTNTPEFGLPLPLPASRSSCLTHNEIDQGIGPNSFAKDAGVRPARTNSTICCLRSAVYRTALFAIMMLVILAVCAPQARSAPVSVIFDTDMYSDIDDTLALAMLHALQDRGEVKLLAVTVTTEAKWIAPYVDLVDTFYGHRYIPVGMVRGGVPAKIFDQKPPAEQPFSPNGINYTQYLAQVQNKHGSLVYPHKLIDGDKAEEAVHLLRRVLAAQPEGSVVMIQVGYCTNFARLLDSKADGISELEGRELVKHKVRFLSTMAGSYAAIEWDGGGIAAKKSEFNLRMDIPAARKLFAEWPTPIVASGFEVGLTMLFPQKSIDREFNYVEHHPIAETYNYTAPYYRKASKNPDAPHDHSTFDLTAVLYAVRPDDGYFSLSPPGKISVLPDGSSPFEAMDGGQHRYLILADAQRARALEAMVMLASQPPVHRVVN